mmetsp:Transcript_27259/g.62927  ORF Transcript_27259/g.62927 Transcript_27259/m.62927 type:complete len:235 (+) Transcript_27259:99-803(+)
MVQEERNGSWQFSKHCVRSFLRSRLRPQIRQTRFQIVRLCRRRHAFRGRRRFLPHGSRLGKGLSQFQIVRVGRLRNEFVHLFGRRRRGRGGVHGPLHVLRLDVQIFKLRFKLVHDGAQLFDIHARQRLVHPLDDALHARADLIHPDGRFDARTTRVESGRHAQMIEGLILFPNGILTVDFGTLVVALFNGLFQLAQRRLFVLFALFGRASLCVQWGFMYIYIYMLVVVVVLDEE